jgi:S-adenosylmethionine decarboxylase
LDVSQKKNNIESRERISNENVGRHCILEIYECDPAKLNDEAFVRTTITSSAKMAGATLLNLITHSFKPQGVTGLALLAESHISIHTWPEIGYAAIDVFTCGNHTMPENACEFFSKEFLAKQHSLKSIVREIPKQLQTLRRDP